MLFVIMDKNRGFDVIFRKYFSFQRKMSVINLFYLLF